MTNIRLTLVATILLFLGAFDHAVSLVNEGQQVLLLDDDMNFSPTVTPTLPIISVTLPAGVTAQDEDIADVIDSLIRGEPAASSNDQENSTSNEELLPNVSRVETEFRLEFKSHNSRHLSRMHQELFEDLLERYTVHFSPLPIDEVESKITTTCTVVKQVVLQQDGNRRLRTKNQRQEKEDRFLQSSVMAILQVYFTIAYESTYFDVTDYPKLFQDWTSSNLDVLLDQLQFLNFDITSVNAPLRVSEFSSTPTMAHSRHPSREPTVVYPELEDSSSDVLSGCLPPKESRWSATAIVVFSISLLLAIVTMAVAISIFVDHHRAHDDSRMEDSDNERTPEQDAGKNDDSCESTTITSGGISPRCYQEDASCSLENI